MKTKNPKKQAEKTFKEIQGYNRNELKEMINHIYKLANEQCIIGERREISVR